MPSGEAFDLLRFASAVAKALRNAEWFVGVRIVNECAGREAAHVDDELRIVGAVKESGFPRDRFSAGE